MKLTEKWLSWRLATINQNDILLYINNRVGQQVIPTYMKSSPYKVYTWNNVSKSNHKQWAFKIWHW